MPSLLLIASILNIFYTIDTSNVNFNTAVRHYNMQQFSESEKYFNQINIPDSNLNASVELYLGNISFKKEDYSKAIAHYKNSLRFATNSKAKHNLVIAREKLNEMQNPENKQKEQQQNQLLNEAKQLEMQAMQKKNKQNKQGTYIKNW